MQKKPFTQAGFTALQNELYSLNDEALAGYVAQINSSFKVFIQDNLELSQTQLEFMTGLDPRIISFLESQTSIAVSNRLTISLDKEPNDDDDKTGKVIKPKSSFTATVHHNGHVVTTGDLIIQIYYLN